MAVTFDSKFEKGVANQSSPFSYVSNAGDVTGSVGSNSNRVLIASLVSTAAVTSPAVTWNGVSMTLIGASTTTAAGIILYRFGLIAPATGAQTISASWTGGPGDTALGAVSVYNADQTTGWTDRGTASGSSTSASITITTTTNDMAIGFRVDDNASSATISSGTQAWDERDLNGNNGAGYLVASGASTVISWTLGTSVSWRMGGVQVLQAAAAGAAGHGAHLAFQRNRHVLPLML